MSMEIFTSVDGTPDQMTSGERIKILIVDDHAIVTESLSLYLDRDGLEVIGTAANGQRALDMTLQLDPDVVLLDIHMPGMDGFQTLAAIKSARPNARVIILSSDPKPQYLARAILLGASGFMSKSDDPKQLLHAIRVVAAGDAIVDQDLLHAALSELGSLPPVLNRGTYQGTPNLTGQETRVLKMVAAGLDNDSIIQALSVTRNTVKTHMRNIYSKLGVSDRTQAAIWAIRNGLAD